MGTAASDLADELAELTFSLAHTSEPVRAAGIRAAIRRLETAEPPATPTRRPE